MKNKKVEFLKTGIYRNKTYNKGDIILMSSMDVAAYIQCKKVKLYIPKLLNRTNDNDLSKKTYKELREICKERGILQIGNKNELIKKILECREVEG